VCWPVSLLSLTSIYLDRVGCLGILLCMYEGGTGRFQAGACARPVGQVCAAGLQAAAATRRRTTRKAQNRGDVRSPPVPFYFSHTRFLLPILNPISQWNKARPLFQPRLSTRSPATRLSDTSLPGHMCPQPHLRWSRRLCLMSWLLPLPRPAAHCR